jgi:hypothetical protein
MKFEAEVGDRPALRVLVSDQSEGGDYKLRPMCL